MQQGESSLSCTAHARARMKQRGIDDAAVGVLLDYGRVEHQPGGSRIFYIDKQGRRELRDELGETAARRLGKRLGAFAVLTPEGAVLTVGHRFRRIRRYG